MKIKYRITILFTVLVTLISLMICSSVYYFSDLNRKKSFAKRLRNRATTTANLLLTVNGIDNNLLRKIDETTIITIQEKSVVVYTSDFKELYSYTDNNIEPVKVDSRLLRKAEQEKEVSFSEGRREAVALYYVDENKPYIVVAAAYDRDGIEKLSQLRFILSISFLTSILITFCTGYFFSKRIVAPIKKISRDVKEISSQNLSRRINLQDAKDELYELSSTFNDLLQRLEKSFEIQRHFIANASHELSTPLTSISSQLEVTLQNERKADDYKKVIRSVYMDVKDLTRLTRSLLEIAKASGTSNGMELVLVRIDELLMKLPAELRDTDASYQVVLLFDNFPEEDDLLLVFGNPELLYSAIKNVVVNACKYGTDHTATISLGFSSNKLQIIISDNGPGILDEEKNLIFQPFYRSKKNSDIPGFGLGLSLAYRIITLHKGSMEISNNTDTGAAFTIELPIARVFHKI